MSLTLEVNIFDKNGWFLFPYTCQEDPKQPGVFIQPIDSTIVPLPSYTPGTQLPQFVLGVWNVEPDYRGETWYDITTGTPEIISEPGVPSSSLTATAPVVTPVVQPNLSGFLNGLSTAMGGIVAANTLLNSYTALPISLQIGNYADATTLIEHALSISAITATQYAAIKTLAATNDIPLTLT